VFRSLLKQVLLDGLTRMAVRYLTQACVLIHRLRTLRPKHVAPYRDRCEALPERRAAAPPLIPLNHDERQHAKTFLATLQNWATHDTDVIKIDCLA